jgi:hypothetical protein
LVVWNQATSSIAIEEERIKFSVMSVTKSPDGVQAAFDWRKHLKVHPAADEYPLLREIDPAGFKALVEDIRKHGLQEELVFWHSGDVNDHWLIDGRNRLDALAELGILGLDEHGYLAYDISDNADTIWGSLIGYPVEGDPYAIAASYNLHRRHLNAEQKRDLIAKLLKAKPAASNLAVAKQVKADDKTVASVRTELEGRSEIPNVEKRKDSKGRQQPARRSGGPRHKCWQCGARALVGEVNQHKYAAYEEADVWLHDSCVAAFEAEIERDRKECIALYQKACAAERELAQWRADHPVETDGAEASADEELEESKEAIRFSGILNLMCATILRTTTAAVAAEMQTTPGQINLLREATNFLLDVMVELD